MKAIEKELLKKVDTISGRVILVGISFDAFIKNIEKNKNIDTVDLLNSFQKQSKVKKAEERASLDIPLKKIRKIYKKKNIDFIFINFIHIKSFLKDFVGHSIYINKKEVYIVFETNKDASYVQRLYDNYGCQTSLKKYGKSYLLEVNTENIKTSKLKDLYLKISVKTENVLELVEKNI